MLAPMQIVQEYYARFNAHDFDGMVELLADDVVHEVCQGEVRAGAAAFKEFLSHMDECYREHVRDLWVCGEGDRVAAEFWLDGEYLKTDGDLPEARGQKYTLRVGAFFEVRGGKIARVSNHYNLQDWLRQIS